MMWLDVPHSGLKSDLYAFLMLQLHRLMVLLGHVIQVTYCLYVRMKVCKKQMLKLLRNNLVALGDKLSCSCICCIIVSVAKI